MEAKQIIGRVWRMGQIHRVIVYHLLAIGTSDMTMSALAFGKGEMLKRFTTSNERSMCDVPFFPESLR